MARMFLVFWIVLSVLVCMGLGIFVAVHETIAGVALLVLAMILGGLAISLMRLSGRPVVRYRTITHTTRQRRSRRTNEHVTRSSTRTAA